MSKSGVRANRSLRAWLLAAGIAIFTLVALLVLINIALLSLGGILIIADPLEPAQVVVVLSGGRGDRIEEAARIIQEKNARHLILTHPEIDPDDESSSERRRQSAIAAGIPGSDILVTEVHGNSTYQEAIEIRRFLEEQGLMSALVVTDPYHSFRTRLIFREIFRDSSVDINVRSVRDHWYRSNTWWTSVEGRQATVMEYGKLLAFFVGIRSG
jgi:uncharacterized SAM-binding protein YcdF (DUF218 family)